MASFVGIALRLSRCMLIMMQFCVRQRCVMRCRSQGLLARLRSTVVMLCGVLLGVSMQDWP